MFLIQELVIIELYITGLTAEQPLKYGNTKNGKTSPKNTNFLLLVSTHHFSDSTQATSVICM